MKEREEEERERMRERKREREKSREATTKSFWVRKGMIQSGGEKEVR